MLADAKNNQGGMRSLILINVTTVWILKARSVASNTEVEMQLIDPPILQLLGGNFQSLKMQAVKRPKGKWQFQQGSVFTHKILTLARIAGDHRGP